MTKLAIIDLDGVVADASARFAVAEEVKQKYVREMQEEFSIQDERGATDTYWQTVFNPEHVHLDTLIEGAKEELKALRFQHRYELLFLTSRPETMREATIRWLFENNILFLLSIGGVSTPALVMKSPAFQYVKTVVWKAGVVQMLVALYNASDVLIVEDEQANINEHLKYVSAEVQTRQMYTSLKEAVEALKEE